MLDWAARELDFFVLAGDEGRRDSPEGDEDRDGREEAEEDCGLQATADFPGQVEGDDEEDREEELVGKPVTAGAVSREGGILDGRILDTELAEFNGITRCLQRCSRGNRWQWSLQRSSSHRNPRISQMWA